MLNSARRGGVDGEDTNARGTRLRAVLEDKDASTSKLLVGPAFLQVRTSPAGSSPCPRTRPTPSSDTSGRSSRGAPPRVSRTRKTGSAPRATVRTTRDCGCSRVSRRSRGRHRAHARHRERRGVRHVGAEAGDAGGVRVSGVRTWGPRTGRGASAGLENTLVPPSGCAWLRVTYGAGIDFPSRMW